MNDAEQLEKFYKRGYRQGAIDMCRKVMMGLEHFLNFEFTLKTPLHKLWEKVEGICQEQLAGTEDELDEVKKENEKNNS